MVLEKSAELGQALVDSDVYKAFVDAQTKFQQDEEALELLSKYQMKESTLKQAMAMDPADSDNVLAQQSEELETMRQAIDENPTICALRESQDAFEALMAQVNQVIGRYINPSSGGCGEGGCDSCSGCH